MTEAVIIIDPQQRIVLFSPGAEAMFGHRAADLIGRPLDILLPETMHAAHQEYVRQFATGRVAYRTMAGRPEIRGRRQDGTLFPAAAVLTRATIGQQHFMAAVVYDLGSPRAADGVDDLLQPVHRLTAIENPVGIAFFDRAGRCVEANPTAAVQLGLAPEALRGKPIARWMAPGNVRAIRRVVQPVLSGSLPFSTGNVHYLRHDESSFEAQITVAPILKETGLVTHVIVLVEDGSIQRWRDLRQRYRTLLEAVDGIVWEMAADSLAIRFISPEAERLLGFCGADWLSDPAFWQQAVHPEDRERVIAWRRNAGSGGTTGRLEYRMIAADGRVLWLRDAVSAASEEGHTLLRGLTVDITEHRQRETALEEKTTDLGIITRILNVFLATGSEQRANRLMLQCALHQTGSTIGFIGIGDEDDLCIVDCIGDCIGDYTGDCTGRGVDRIPLAGVCATILAEAAPARHADPGHPLSGLPWQGEEIHAFLGVPILIGGRAVGLIGVANPPEGYSDASRIRLESLARVAAVLQDARRRTLREAEMEYQLQRSQRMEAIGQLTGGIAHDFNNLLLVIQGNAERVQDALAEGSEEHFATHQILYAAHRAAELTRNLLSFARRNPMAPTAVDLDAMLQDVGPLLQRTLGEQIRVRMRIGSPVVVIADRAQLESALLNLALNARDAMPTGGVLTIAIDAVVIGEEVARLHELAPGRYGQIQVTDTGTGMSPEVRDRLFEPFFTTKEPGKGTGLGLAMVYGFARQSNGQVSVTTQPGDGTTLTLLLPATNLPGPVRTRHTGAPAQNDTPARILVVEDNHDLRAMVVTQLASFGHHTVEAVDGASALAALERHPDIDLLFTDIVMPGGLYGHQLAAQARQLRPGLKTLLTSGFPPEHDLPRSGFTTAPATLIKPYLKADLIAAVRRALADPAPGTDSTDR